MSGSTSFLEMSDDDFLKQSPPEVVVETVVVAAVEENKPATTEELAPVVEAPTTVEAPADTVAGAVDADRIDTDAETLATKPEPVVVTKPVEPVTTDPVTPEAKPGEQKPVDGKPGEVDKTKPVEGAAPAALTPADHEAFYRQVMAPFKANGKMIELKTPAEAIQLMQMGANYTRKMQDLVPHRKVLLMLENNGLLDEGKLSYLIDLNQKNPDAIKKLVKEAGLDPTEIDTTAESAYREGNHRVSDEEATFRTALDDLKSNQPGVETLKIINADWDQASKDVLWKSPEVMAVIHEQREAGIYDRITAEVNRQKTLGRIAPEVPFLNAYKAVGDQMAEANAFADLITKNAPAAPVVAPAPVATRTAAPKPVVANNDKALAASPSRTTPKTAQAFVNPLAMSDEDFLKHMANRV